MDVTAPAAPSITSAPASLVNSNSASFGFSHTETGTTFECSLDSTTAYSSCTSPRNYTSLSEGSHTFRVRALDAAGNVGSPASHTWTVDTIGPVSTITFTANGGRYTNSGFNAGCGTASTGDFCGSASDANGISQVRVSLQRVTGGAYWNGTGFVSTTEVLLTPTGTTSWNLPFNPTNFPLEGNYILRVRATDAAGNTGAVATSTFTIDRTAPTANDIQTTNGGIAGRADAGDTIIFTYSEAMDPNSILSSWNGSSTSVTVRMIKGSGSNPDTFTVLGTNLGSVSLGRNDYVSNTVNFPSSMVMNGSTITVTLGAVDNSQRINTTATGTGSMVWTPSASALDLAGNACSTTGVTQSGLVRRQF
jgi:hypothetical protein